MFRIDRNLVNLATARSVQVDSEETVAGAEEVSREAPAPVAFYEQETIEKAKEQAEAILSDAREEAASMIAQARQQAEEERGQAWQEGYAKGAQEGRRIAEEKCEEQYVTKYELHKQEYEAKKCEDDEMLRRVIDEIYTERKTTYEEIENNIIGLSMDIVKKIIDPAEDVLGGVFEGLIRNALKQIAPEGKVIIRVSPAEYERFFSSGSAFFELDKGVRITAAVLRDTSLGEFDCVIDTDDETVNAGLDTQLKYIKIAFNRADD